MKVEPTYFLIFSYHPDQMRNLTPSADVYLHKKNLSLLSIKLYPFSRSIYYSVKDDVSYQGTVNFQVSLCYRIHWSCILRLTEITSRNTSATDFHPDLRLCFILYL